MADQDMADQDAIAAKTPETASSSDATLVPKQPQSYEEFLKDDFNELFTELNLSDPQKRYLRSRWLDQVLWMEKRAAYNRNWHYRLRLTAIVGGVIIPILVSLGGDCSNRFRDVLKVGTLALSGVVAVTAAVEEFYHYGERWYHYRRTVESLKAQGWQFFELSGVYRTYRTPPKSREDAFVHFADQVEDIIRSDVDFYVTQLTRDKKQENETEDKPKQVSKADNEVS